MASWDERYRAGEGQGRAADPVVVTTVATLPPGSALDLACGLGRHSILLAQSGWMVTAVDSSSVALALLAPHPNLQLLEVDLEAPGVALQPEAYDLVIDSLFLHRPLFPHIRSCLRPGGVFIGIFPVTGVRDNFLISPDDLIKEFPGWQTMHFAQSPRLELVCRKPATHD